MAELRFTDAALSGLVTTVGGHTLSIQSEAEKLGLTIAEVERLERSMGFSKRQVVVGNVTTSDLCLASAMKLLDGKGIDPQDIDALIFVTQTPDYSAPSTAISLAHKLGMRVDTMCFDMRLGCSGFVYGLGNAYSLVQSGLSKVLLCVGDVASKMVPLADPTITPIMGDAGAAALIERQPAKSVFHFYSDGAGERALFIPNSGVKIDDRDLGKPSLMTMDGAAVFNFTLKRVPSLIDGILAAAKWDADAIDYFVMHQPNKYILQNIQKRLKIPQEKFPVSTQSVYGNQNSASIPGTISGFLQEDYSRRSTRSIFAGFGIGLSWAACAVELSPLYAPFVEFYSEMDA